MPASDWFRDVPRVIGSPVDPDSGPGTSLAVPLAGAICVHNLEARLIAATVVFANLVWLAGDRRKVCLKHQRLFFVCSAFQNPIPEKYPSHLSKGTSGLEQKCTQTPTSVLGPVFHALSHGVIHFVPRVSSKNLEMEVSDWL